MEAPVSIERKNTNELVLSDGQYAYTQDTTSGIIKTHTGPLVINVTGQEIPVVYNAVTQNFERVALEAAACQSPLAAQGSYCVLWNPAENGRHPDEKGKTIAQPLSMGQRVNIPGPCTFALWPRQSAKVIEGHHLRSNQYLFVRVYDEEAARANWGRAVIKPAAGQVGGPSDKSADKKADKARQPEGKHPEGKQPEGKRPEDKLSEVSGAPRDLSLGKLIVIRGTEVSFYMPPTGVEIVVDEAGRYVREALTLERLEYCILIDEDGNKRYERGPAVVFPKPTEHFYEDDDSGHEGGRVFRPIELNPIQGIHVKVIAGYTDGETGQVCTEGEELFITGKDTPIYFPRQEHSLISYDGSSKHFATAVPAGEARYVMHRKTGEIRMVKGPTMLLPDPRDEVIVRRALTDRQCVMWYPGNVDALAYNQRLRELAAQAPTTRSGAVSEGQIGRGRKQRGRKGGMRLDESTAMEASRTTADVPAIMADKFSLGSTYTEPRTLTLHTRFAGVPTIEVWNGFAVMVVNRSGGRRVEVGPTSVLLGYDESLEVLELSAGRPKSPCKSRHTAYLRQRNNRVTDIVSVETLDRVKVSLSISMRVDFEGEPARWFSVENYVQVLCDHVRALFKVRARALTIEALYERAEEVLRDAVLGEAPAEGGERPGLAFEGNGMRVVDVEVQSVTVGDDRIAGLIEQAHQQAVRANIELAAARRQLDAVKKVEAIAREKADVEAETARHKAELSVEALGLALNRTIKELEGEAREQVERLSAQKARDEVADAGHLASLERKKKNAEMDQAIEQERQRLLLAMIDAETQATVQRLGAVQEGFTEALLALGNQETLVKVAEAMIVQQLLGGRSLPEVLGRVFDNTPLDEIIGRVQRRAAALSPANGHAAATDKPRA